MEFLFHTINRSPEERVYIFGSANEEQDWVIDRSGTCAITYDEGDFVSGTAQPLSSPERIFMGEPGGGEIHLLATAYGKVEIDTDLGQVHVPRAYLIPEFGRKLLSQQQIENEYCFTEDPNEITITQKSSGDVVSVAKRSDDNEFYRIACHEREDPNISPKFRHK
mmetsp:Transcript_18284/g.24112  ORF Transcript_18284/g.24112 Transcript_18284/m.24112 type:complete len:165 (+) Transcript_18284:84-578(+)